MDYKKLFISILCLAFAVAADGYTDNAKGKDGSNRVIKGGDGGEGGGSLLFGGKGGKGGHGKDSAGAGGKGGSGLVKNGKDGENGKCTKTDLEHIQTESENPEQNPPNKNECSSKEIDNRQDGELG